MSVFVQRGAPARSLRGAGAVRHVGDTRFRRGDITGGLIHRFYPETASGETVDFCGPAKRPGKPMCGGPGLDMPSVTSPRLGFDPERHGPGAGSHFAVTGLGVGGVPRQRFAR